MPTPNLRRVRRGHPLLVAWGWDKSADTRQPTTATLRVEDADTLDVVLDVQLTPEQVTALLSGTVVRATGSVIAP